MSEKKQTENNSPLAKTVEELVPHKGDEQKKSGGPRPQGPNGSAGAPGLSPIVIASIWMGFGAYALTSFLPVALAMIGYGFSFLVSSLRSTSREKSGEKEASAAKVVKVAKAAKAAKAAKKAKAGSEPGAGGVKIGLPQNLTSQRAKEIALPLILTLVGYLVGAVYPPASYVSLLLGFLGAVLALVVAWLVAAKRASITSAYVLAAVSTVVLVAIEAAAAWIHGQTLMQTVQASVMDAVSTVKPSLPLEMQGELVTFVPLIQMLWPFSLFCMAGACVALVHASARIAQLNVLARERTSMSQMKVWNFSAFDSPFWAPIALAVGAALFFFGPVLQGFSATAAFWVRSAGLGTVAAVRFIFLFDGVGVLSWLFLKNRWGCVIRVFVMAIALYLEAIFFVLSILGLVDFWVNFRKLSRRTGAKKA